MIKYIFFTLTGTLILCACKTKQAPERLLPQSIITEKEYLMETTNRNYTDASVVGLGARQVKEISGLDSFYNSVQEATGVSVDEATGVLTIHDNILFDFNSAQVKEEALPSLQHIASSFSRLPNASLQIFGHTDSIGSPAYNQALSERRAQSVSTALQSFGIPPTRIETFGRGATSPIASNALSAGRSKNRRVEFIVVP